MKKTGKAHRGWLSNRLSADPSGAVRRRGAPRKVTRDDVLAAATRQINRRGVLATLLKDVATDLGVTRMTIYQHAEDREDLVFQCYMQTCATLEARISETLTAPGDALKRIGLLLDRLLGENASEMCAIVELGLLPEEKRGRVERDFDNVVGQLASVVERGAADGEIRPCTF